MLFKLYSEKLTEENGFFYELSMNYTVTSCCITFPSHSPISSVVYLIDFVHYLKIIQNNFADLMTKERVIASKKTKTITKPKTVIDLGEDLPIFFCSFKC